jgi:AraC-like DNA-binding protein
VQYLHANYHRKIDLQTVAQHLHLGAAHFSKLFKEEMGQSVAQYLNHIRVERSKELLRDLCLPLIEIADRVGFEDQSYFTKVFGRLTGMSPGRYRKNRGQREEANLEIHERELRISVGVADVPPELAYMRARQLDGVLNVVDHQPIGERVRRSA